MRAKVMDLGRAVGGPRAQVPVMAVATVVAGLTGAAAVAESLRWSVLGLTVLAWLAVLLVVDARFRLAQLERVQRLKDAEPDPAVRMEHTLRRVLAAVETSRLESLDRYAELVAGRPGAAARTEESEEAARA
ncbi:hypothetical protein [Sporichthya polymorpha]|uniref:hypothetical protein n=1 Tax=Sporichthya polymorpha TaxID=35751 RepID=UPI000373F37E|nr:hypothetical protein [Sporichthya polymorpha]